jgi:hypothetical protein
MFTVRMTSNPQNLSLPAKRFVLGLFCLVTSLASSVLLAQQSTKPGAREDVTVTESRLGVVCDSFTNRCTQTQMLVVKVGARKLELRMYESKPEPLLSTGVYPGQRVQGKASSTYRLDEAYVLTFPDGKTERFDVVGVLQ